MSSNYKILSFIEFEILFEKSLGRNVSIHAYVCTVFGMSLFILGRSFHRIPATVRVSTRRITTRITTTART